MRNDELNVGLGTICKIVLKKSRLIIILDEFYQFISAYELRQIYFLAINLLMRAIGISNAKSIFFRTWL